MFDQAGAPFRLWGYGHSMQAILMSHQGLVIRNGDDRVLIPVEAVKRFQRELEGLLDAVELADVTAQRGS